VLAELLEAEPQIDHAFELCKCKDYYNGTMDPKPTRKYVNWITLATSVRYLDGTQHAPNRAHKRYPDQDGRNIRFTQPREDTA
jgi:hypothetical protein